MKRRELSERLIKLEKNAQIIEAFMLRSAYVDSVFTTLIAAYLCHKKGFDGVIRKVSDAVQSDPAFEVQFRKMSKMTLEKRIGLLKETKLAGVTETNELERWREDRNLVFHWFAHLMLSNELEKTANQGNIKIKRIMEHEWFKKMEDTVALMEQKIK